MRIDVVTIFPDYLAPLALSLPGKAARTGLLDLTVHDLRAWTHDRHRTVDDTPYGGGAGMVMKPEPWGEALDALLTEDAVLLVPTPSGEPFTQALAAELSAERHLVIACGRYEGIDQRVSEDAATRVRVREVSLGDYVLNGGEVAALAVIEAVVRLLPGFMGNPESLIEESHTDGLLEYPVYTKPALWRGRAVPDVLLSGDHGRIAAWRRAESVRRTVARRPDLAAPSTLVSTDLGAVGVTSAVPADAGEILTLQRAAYAGQPGHPALAETLEEVRHALGSTTVLLARAGGRLVGVARAATPPTRPDLWLLDRLLVAPDLVGSGLGRLLLDAVERSAPGDVTAYVVDAGTLPEGGRAHGLLRRAGYRPGPGPGPGSRARTADPAGPWLRKRRR